MATAAAHAALMAVAAAQEVWMLTADDSRGLHRSLQGQRACHAVGVVDQSFRARSVAKKLVKGTGPMMTLMRLPREGNDEPRTSAGYQPGPDDMGPSDLRITSGWR